MEAEQLEQKQLPESRFTNMLRERNKEQAVECVEKEPLELALGRLNEENKQLRSAISSMAVQMGLNTKEELDVMRFSDFADLPGRAYTTYRFAQDTATKSGNKLKAATQLLKEAWAFVNSDLSSASLASQMRSFAQDFPALPGHG